MAKSRTIIHDIFGKPIRENEGINSKVKGNRNEVEAAKWLERWTGQPFIRTPSSGGRRLQNAANFCGDVVCCNDDYTFIFCVETKHYKELAVTQVLRENSELYTIWKQAVRDAKRANKIPMMMLRKNGMKKGFYYIFFDTKTAEVFKAMGVQVVSTGEGIKGFISEDIVKHFLTETIINHIKTVSLG